MSVQLKAKKREDLTHSNTKALRESGFIPGVVYGKAKDTKNIAVESITLLKTVRDEGKNAVISLDIEEDKPVNVMLHEYQVDPIRDAVTHVDFYIVDLSEEMEVSVVLNLQGEAKGAKEGGVLQQPLFEVQILAKPSDIPEEITLDISSLEIGNVLTIADLPVSDTYKYLDDPDTTIATILPPGGNEVEEEAEEETETEAETQE
ncbi:50S ribosomal protein L25/general stress protein Ctc [Oceanobacillus sp. 143]|uniref:Large ribosomal subunit protein bL25 n=1 Tax=Oceanobacillus zhaokaii TaxID=2052660 RepID=A0A345PC14_9BACI|nr:50S ribosomal protein L25/general stress protein Ctc [Oceanobacillus zhaokaii]AXI07544.1 50S ribosomal protein L25/general stress protein Ctc [Oceanobacillus zhaokaii]QGS67771.1 50S ribosomal protein L25/general stress protein Ctc [Oceanobacillus sp. 143]